VRRSFVGVASVGTHHELTAGDENELDAGFRLDPDIFP
jgi:hypothetical protein